MKGSFDKYYLGELAFLREMGKSFAEVHPAVARMLAERGADPDVERLLEGFAFLTARIRQRLDNALPEVLEHFVSVLLPQSLRTTPATTMIAMAPKPGVVRGRTLVPRGTPLASRPVDGTPCAFRTTQDVELVPVTLTAQRIEDATSQNPALVLSLDVMAGAQEAFFHERGLRLFFHGELATASHLYMWVRRHCKRVVISNEKGQQVTLPRDALVPVGFDDDTALVPWPRVANSAYRLLSEWMTYPAKFLFVDVLGLTRAAELGVGKLTMRFEFDRPPPSPARIPNDVVRLNVAPAVNLFTTSADPVRGDGTNAPVLLRASGLSALHAEVFSVESVVGVVNRTGERVTHLPFHELGHAGQKDAYYTLHREHSPVDDGIHVSIGLGTPRDAKAIPEQETLSVELVCTNRSLPQALKIGDVCVPTRSTPGSFTFENIALVSRPQRPPLGELAHDRLASHLVVHRRTLTEASCLRQLLSIYNVPEKSDEPLARSNRRRIESVRATRAQSSVRIVDGAPVRGVSLDIEIDETAFGSLGEAYLFGEVLERALSELTPVNGFLRTSFILFPSQTRLEWKARIGSIPIF